jgi:hypothetical protein
MPTDVAQTAGDHSSHRQFLPSFIEAFSASRPG